MCQMLEVYGRLKVIVSRICISLEEGTKYSKQDLKSQKKILR